MVRPVTHFQKSGLLCPNCGKGISAFTNVPPNQSPPRIGDLAVCLYCAEFLVYAISPDGRTLRKLQPEEWVSLTDAQKYQLTELSTALVRGKDDAKRSTNP